MGLIPKDWKHLGLKLLKNLFCYNNKVTRKVKDFKKNDANALSYPPLGLALGLETRLNANPNPNLRGYESGLASKKLSNKDIYLNFQSI